MSATHPIVLGRQPIPNQPSRVEGEIVQRDAFGSAGERFYVIRNCDQMPAFFTCLVSSADHWLFASSNGGLSAGRRNSTNALFPYVTEDKVRDNFQTTGPYSAFLVAEGEGRVLWEPFRDSAALAYRVQRNVYKSVAGDKLGFEEVNLDLGLRFYYEWVTSEHYGFVRRCLLSNLRTTARSVSVLDGVQDLLPACVDEQLQLGFSCLLDAYKTSELVTDRLGVYSLASQPVDRAEPREALRATTVLGLGLPAPTVLLSAQQLAQFRRGQDVFKETAVRGKRGAYFQVSQLALAPSAGHSWCLVADVNRTQVQVARGKVELEYPEQLEAAIHASVARGAEKLRRIVAQTDGLQVSEDELTTVHHFANTLFNDMRGGVYAEHYQIQRSEFSEFVRSANRDVYERQRQFLESLEPVETKQALLRRAEELADPDILRFSLEYLPLTFSRRHGDPSRPWNRFDIQVRDAQGQQLLGFQGNWRDIFQNWEALSRSYPGFVESIIAKFVNASTADGYNPYRISHRGIDWEQPEPGNPWAGIGYWGDHQIVYLLKLLELSRDHQPEQIGSLLTQPLFSYANVPYHIKPYEQIVANPNETIDFDHEQNSAIQALSKRFGSDAKLLMRAGTTEVYRVTLLEKLLVTSLAKMGNYVPGGGIWLNTQRPEWNDANNALVGNGVSMVTLCYLARYFHYLADTLESLSGASLELSQEVSVWLTGTLRVLTSQPLKAEKDVGNKARGSVVASLGRLSSDYRTRVYASGFQGKVRVHTEELQAYVAACREHLQHTLSLARRTDGLFHSYNLLAFEADERVSVAPLYEMLEGQVAALSAGVLKPGQVLELLTQLRQSTMYRSDQASYTLYPNRQLPSFLDKNTLKESELQLYPFLSKLSQSANPLLERDAENNYRFAPELVNAAHCEIALDELKASGFAVSEQDRAEVLKAYESVFQHREFTGRSGTMFAYEGLGSIYWHMVAKLLLAVQENFFWAKERGASEQEISDLAEQYYELRRGVGGFNKTPLNYGAFPTDPYSHTPEDAGARQPGMTGQVKEEVLTRLGELGVVVKAGKVRFSPSLLRDSEFLREQRPLHTFDVQGAAVELMVAAGSLAFSYCQVPVIYRRSEELGIVVVMMNGEAQPLSGDELTAELSRELFERTGRIQRIEVSTRAGLK